MELVGWFLELAHFFPSKFGSRHLFVYICFQLRTFLNSYHILHAHFVIFLGCQRLLSCQRLQTISVSTKRKYRPLFF